MKINRLESYVKKDLILCNFLFGNNKSIVYIYKSYLKLLAYFLIYL